MEKKTEPKGKPEKHQPGGAPKPRTPDTGAAPHKQ
jgi:hypothetical protein